MHRFQRWRDVLRVAPNTQTIIRVVDDYVATLDPYLDALPRECKLALTKPIDVQGAAVTLLQAEMGFSGREEVREVLHEIAHTFAAASVRLTTLHRNPLQPTG
jgi:hypothetical protein